MIGLTTVFGAFKPIRPMTRNKRQIESTQANFLNSSRKVAGKHSFANSEESAWSGELSIRGEAAGAEPGEIEKSLML